MNTDDNNVCYDVPSSSFSSMYSYDSDSRHYRKNKPHISLNQVDIEYPKEGFSFFEQLDD